MNRKIKEIILKYKADILFLISAIIIMFFVTNCIAILNIKGNSMYPTYQDGNILVMKINSNIRNKDIIIFDSPASWGSEERKFIKRVVATEGDSLEVVNSSLIVNGELVDNKKEAHCGNPAISNKVTLNKNELFVMGDNIGSSNDSLAQLCNGNKEFLIKKDSNTITGTELILLERGLFN